jgi:hypothetical protein
VTDPAEARSLPDRSARPVRFELDLSALPPEFIGPRIPACRIEDHRWTLTIEDGRPSLNCVDACSEERKMTMDTDQHSPMCDVVGEFTDFMHMEGEIIVRPVIETSHTPSTTRLRHQPARPSGMRGWFCTQNRRALLTSRRPADDPALNGCRVPGL